MYHKNICEFASSSLSKLVRGERGGHLCGGACRGIGRERGNPEIKEDCSRRGGYWTIEGEDTGSLSTHLVFDGVGFRQRKK